MTKRKLVQLLPLLILTGGLTYTVIGNEFKLGYFDVQLWGGFILTVVSGLTFVTLKKVYNKALGFTLILGTVNLIEFLPRTVTIGGGINGHTIELQFFSFATLLIFSFINRQRIKQVIRGIIKTEPMTEAAIAEQKEKKIEGFVLKYKDKSTGELLRISNSPNMFDKEAVEAANRLLIEKNVR